MQTGFQETFVFLFILRKSIKINIQEYKFFTISPLTVVSQLQFEKAGPNVVLQQFHSQF